MNLTSLVSGAVFIVLGVIFLLDRLTIIDVTPGIVLPILLVGVGVGVLAGSLRREPGPEPPDDAAAPDP